jgi:hypothetical protein
VESHCWIYANKKNLILWRRLKPLINGAEEMWKIAEKDIQQFIENN